LSFAADAASAYAIYYAAAAIRAAHARLRRHLPLRRFLPLFHFHCRHDFIAAVRFRLPLPPRYYAPRRLPRCFSPFFAIFDIYDFRRRFFDYLPPLIFRAHFAFFSISPCLRQFYFAIIFLSLLPGLMPHFAMRRFTIHYFRHFSPTPCRHAYFRHCRRFSFSHFSPLFR
jgi:hypothetical protein